MSWEWPWVQVSASFTCPVHSQCCGDSLLGNILLFLVRGQHLYRLQETSWVSPTTASYSSVPGVWKFIKKGKVAGQQGLAVSSWGQTALVQGPGDILCCVSLGELLSGLCPVAAKMTGRQVNSQLSRKLISKGSLF